MSSWFLIRKFSGSGDATLPNIIVSKPHESLGLRWRATTRDEVHLFRLDLDGPALGDEESEGSGLVGETYVSPSKTGRLRVRVSAINIISWEVELWSASPEGERSWVNSMPPREDDLAEVRPFAAPEAAGRSTDDPESSWWQRSQHECEGFEAQWSSAVDFKVPNEVRALLLQEGFGYLPPGALVPDVSQQWLDLIVATAHDTQSMWSFEPDWPSAVWTERFCVVNWRDGGFLKAWVGYPKCGSLVRVSLDTWDIVGNGGPPTNAAAGLAIAWFLDRVIRPPKEHPLFRSVRSRTVLDMASRKTAPPQPHERRAHIRTMVERLGSEAARARAPEYIRRILAPNQTYVRSSQVGGTFESAVQRFLETDSFLRFHAAEAGI